MKQSILVLILALLLAATGVVWFRYARSPASAPAEAGGAEPPLQLDLDQLRRLRGLQLDTAVLQDPFFRGLPVVRATTTLEATPGRSNPFVPF